MILPAVLVRRGKYSVADPLFVEERRPVLVARKLRRGAEAGESVSLDVRQLAQLYAGYLPARDLARHGLVKASSPQALDLLEELFPLGDPCLYGPDHF